MYDFAPATARRLFEGTGYDVTALRTMATPFQFYRETVLSPDQLGSGQRARLLRLSFEALRLAIYPLARLFRRGNAMFIVASGAVEAEASSTKLPSSAT
jgi:hypothetical protein